jgi:hypothetical protein
LILHDLDGHIDDQMVLLDHPEFLRMPSHSQALLTRLLASGYLSVNKKIDEVKVLMSRSWDLNPLDLKTIFIMFLAYFHGGPFAPLFRYWQTIKLQKSFEPSLLDHIKE